MGFMDEIKKLTHPYSDVEEDDYDDYDDEPLDNTPPAAPARDTRRSSSSASSGGAPKGSLSTMIRMIMRTVTARAMIMGSVIERVLLFCVRSPCCARARPFAQFCCGFLD